MILIFQDERRGAELAATKAEEFKAMMGRFFAYNEELKAAKAYVGGEALQPSRTATTVRVRDGKASHTDGPFAETKEQLGGYYLIEAANLDEALAWAAKCPGAHFGAVEVRPVQHFG